ncbi:MAG: glucokinase [Snowella sp.]|nr:glucokinase [Snowella sp.]
MVRVLLAGDIGGTKTILRLVNQDVALPAVSISRQSPLYEQTYPSQAFTDLVPMIRQFLASVTEIMGETPQVEKACFGIAGPVVANTSELTNLSWSLSGDRLATELEISQVTLINDFAAVGYGILGLTSDDVYCLQDVPPTPKAPIAVIGAGTGLGQGYMIPFGDGNYRVFSSEGAHADFAPRSPLEFQLLSFLKERYQFNRVSVERVVSGLGIAAIYDFLRDQNPSQESPPLAEIHKIWQQELGQNEKTVDLSAEVSKAALADRDYLSSQTLKIFVEAYGAEAGNLALKLLPYGGLYVAGGIAPKILPLLQNGDFMKAFSDKGRMRELMAKFPVYIVLNPKVGLIGAAVCAAQS